MYSGYKFFSRYFLCEYCLPFCVLSIHKLEGSLKPKSFHFDELKFTNCCGVFFVTYGVFSVKPLASLNGEG